MSGSNPKALGAGSAAGPRALATAAAGKEEKKKAGGGVLNRLKARRQAAHRAGDDGAAVTEQELLALDAIRPEHVLRLGRVTDSKRAGWGPPRPAPSPAARAPRPTPPPAAARLPDGRGSGPRAPGLRVVYRVSTPGYSGLARRLRVRSRARGYSVSISSGYNVSETNHTSRVCRRCIRDADHTGTPCLENVPCFYAMHPRHGPRPYTMYPSHRRRRYTM